MIAAIARNQGFSEDQLIDMEDGDDEEEEDCSEVDLVENKRVGTGEVEGARENEDRDNDATGPNDDKSSSAPSLPKDEKSLIATLTEINEEAVSAFNQDDIEIAYATLKKGENILEASSDLLESAIDRNTVIVILYNLACCC